MSKPFFRAMRVLRLRNEFNLTPAALHEALATMPFVSCPKSEVQSKGFVAPVPESTHDLVHTSQGNMLIALKTETRILPAQVVKQELAARIEAETTRNGYPPSRKQVKDLKARVTEDLLGKAFTKQATVFLWLDLTNRWAVLSAAGSAGDSLIECLNKALGDLPLAPWMTQISPATAMSQWLAAGEVNDQFTIDDDCELRTIDETKQSVRYRRHTLDTDEVRDHLTGGKLPTHLALTYADRVSFTLCDTGTLKQLAFLDLVEDETDVDALTSHTAFTLTHLECSRLLSALNTALGDFSEEA